MVPVYTFFVLKKKFDVWNAGAIAAAYGSVSAVTFVTSVGFLEMEGIEYGGHMVAVMALMEAPSIIVGMLLISLYKKNKDASSGMGNILKHSMTNCSVMLIMGSLLIGYFASEEQAQGIKPFTTDIFKGFLAVFLLDMGVTSGKKLSTFFKNGKTAFIFAIVVPMINGCLIAFLSGFHHRS